jgi:hypothetical protein
MDRNEAHAVLAAYLNRYRGRSYAELASCVGEGCIDTAQATGARGDEYQIEIQCLWDDKPNGNVRVVASVDDGGLRAFCPLTRCFIIRPDGQFVDE